MLVKILLIALAVLVFGAILVAAMMLLKRRSAAKAAEDPEVKATRKAVEERVAAARSSRNAIFSANLKRLDGTGTGWDQRYRVPWCLLVGEQGAGRTSLLRSIELHRPFGAPEVEHTRQGECEFWFFDRGLVIDAPVSVEQGDDRWIGVLQSIRRARRQRPIDSVAIAIPATDLTGPTKLEGAPLKDKAEGLYRTVRRIQEELGVLMPIYVIVTKTDAIPGFAESCRALPVSAWEEMFGWSSPYSFETNYSPEWVSEAFKNVNATIAQTQMDLLAASPAELKDPDAVYTLPAEFSGLEAPLRVLLDQIFKPTSYHEPFALRGIYFSGDPNVVDSGPTGVQGVVPADLGPEGRRPIFTTQLFESKIFVERGLSRPASRSKVGNRRAILAMQYALGAIAVIAPISLYLAASSLGRQIPVISDAATIINADMDDVTSARDAAPATPINPEQIKSKATETLQAISRINDDHIWRVALPSSWFSDIDLVLRSALKRAFEDVVMYAYRESLEEKKSSLLGKSDLSQADNQARLVAPSNMPEFQALDAIDKEMQTFSEYVKEYNDFGKANPSRKLETVVHLAQYLLSLNLGPAFMGNGALYRDALVNVNYITFDQVAGAKVQDSANALSQALVQHAFQNNTVENDLREIVKDEADFEASNADPDTMVASMAKLSASIERAKADLASPEMAWIRGEDLGEPFTSLLASLKKSPALGASVSQSFDDRWHAEYKEMRRRLFAYSTAATGPILTTLTTTSTQSLIPAVPGSAKVLAAATSMIPGTAKTAVAAVINSPTTNTQLVLGDKILAIDNALTVFLAQPFVKLDRSEPLASITPSDQTRILWSSDSLDKALKLGDPYDAYVHQKLDSAPDHIRSLLEDLAKQELELGVKYLTQKSQRELVTEDASGGGTDAEKNEMSTELSSLRRVVTQLKSLLDLDDRFELIGAGTDLRRTLTAQGESLLRRIDSLLEQGELYTPDAKLLQWHGVRPPALEAFDLAGADALGQYLRTQRSEISDLSRNYAAIPVQIMEMSATGSNASPVLTKWERIATELAARESMQPGNSVQALEQFIQSDMLDLTGDNCLGRLPKRSSEGGDFFLGKLATLRNILRQRCEVINGAKLLARYDLLASIFNETLAGHFPFSSDTAESQEGDASPHDITKFLHEYDAYLPEFNAYRAQSDRAESGSGSWGPFTHDMLVFLNQMKDIRHFFGPLLSQDGVDVTPRYGLRMVPRVNRVREVKANQIIAWNLILSGQRADIKSAMWSLGDPVRLAFRWAKDAPSMPSRDGQDKNVSVSDDDTVNFDYGGSWSLLRLIRSQQAPSSDLDGGVDIRPHTLEFVMRIEDRPTGDEPFGTEPVKEKARAFVRITLTAPDGVTRLVVPKFWPTHAPQVVGLQTAPSGAGTSGGDDSADLSTGSSG